MKGKYKILLKIVYVILIVFFMSNFTACNNEDNIINVKKDNTVYVELDILADIFGNRDSVAQDEEITKIIDFFDTNDELWGFAALSMSYIDTTIASIPATTLSSMFNPNYYFWGPYSSEQIHHDLQKLASIKWPVFLAFVIEQRNDKYYVSRCYKVGRTVIRQMDFWIELEII